MTTYRLSEPEFWTSEPDVLREAQKLAQSKGMNTRHFIMGDPSQATTAVACILQLPPGGELRRHTHNCERLEIIIQGSLDVGGGQILGPGDVMQTPNGQFYGPHIAGPEGCTTAEIFSSINACGNPIYEGEVTS